MLKRKRDDEYHGIGDDMLSSGMKIIGSVMTAIFSALAWVVGFISAFIEEIRKK